MHEQALIKLLGHYWEHEGLPIWKKREEDRIVEDASGLSIRLTGQSVSFTGIPGEGIHIPMLDREKCTFFLPRPKWEALIRHVQKDTPQDEDSAKVYLLNRILEACYIKPRRSNHTASVVCLALLVTVLLSALMFWDPVRPALVVLACLLLGGAVLLLGLTGRGKDEKAASIFNNCLSTEVDSALAQALEALEKPVFSWARGWTAAGMLAGSALCAFIAMQPAYFLMLPAQRVDYFFQEHIPGYIEEAEDALMWMSPGKAKAKLMEKIDGDTEHSYDSLHAAQLAVRLFNNRRISEEDAREVVLHGMDHFDPASGTLTYRLDELRELLSVCTAKDACSFVGKISVQKSISDAVLNALGEATANASVAEQMACYDALEQNGHNGALYLNTALEKAETVETARELLLQAPEEYRHAMAVAWSKNFTTLDETLAYLHMLASIGFTLDDDFTGSMTLTSEVAGDFVRNMRTFRFSATSENRLPEGETTILPLLRTESPEKTDGYFMEDGTSYADLTRMPGYSVHDEDDTSSQWLRLLPQVLAALPAERIPCSVEDANLILLFDQQYLLHSSVELEAYDFVSRKGIRHKPIFEAVQRVSIYDAKTGARLLMIDERRELPPEMSDTAKNKVYREKLKDNIANSTDSYQIYNESDVLDDQVYSSIRHYLIVNFSHYWVEQQIGQICETLQENGGDLSSYLPAENE